MSWYSLSVYSLKNSFILSSGLPILPRLSRLGSLADSARAVMPISNIAMRPDLLLKVDGQRDVGGELSVMDGHVVDRATGGLRGRWL
jgi:hypothetical protein